MDLFYLKKFQRKQTANHQTQDVGFHVKTLGLSGRYYGEPVSQARHETYETMKPLTPRNLRNYETIDSTKPVKP